MVDRSRARHQHRATRRPRCPGGIGRLLSGWHGAPCTFTFGFVLAVAALHIQPFSLTPLRFHALRLAASPAGHPTSTRSPHSLCVRPRITARFPDLVLVLVLVLGGAVLDS